MTMMKIDSEAVDKIEELKGWHFDLTDSKNTYKYEETIKKIGEYVGRIYGKEMKALVVIAKETVIAKPECPTGQNVIEEKKAIGERNMICISKGMRSMIKTKLRHLKLCGEGALRPRRMGLKR